MAIGQLTENGVEVALFPEKTISAIPHKDRKAIDFGGRWFNDWKAPCKLVVKKLMGQFHGVILWTVNPVLTPYGLTHFSLWLMHDNDVTDLTVGKIIEQGVSFYQEGGWGANGAKTYASHIHLNCALGHTTQGKPNANGVYELVNSIWANEIFFLAGDETIVNDGGLVWKVYQAPVTIIQPKPEEPLQIEPVVIDVTPEETVTLPIVTPTPEVTVVLPNEESEAQTETVAKPIAQKPDEIGQEVITSQEIVLEPVQNEPITVPEPLEDPLPEVSVNIPPIKKHWLQVLIEFIIELIKLIKG